MWGAIAAWVACLASVSLPWPGVVLCVMLCCLIYFECASPAAWSNKRRGVNTQTGSNSNSGSSTIDAGNKGSAGGRGGGRMLVEPAAIAGAHLLNWVLEKLHVPVRIEVGPGKMSVQDDGGSGGGRGCGEEKGGAKPRSGHKAPMSATFLKGSVGSFSRGGLMVTHEGRVIYKVNQDKGLISHPSLSDAQHTIFGIFDGHGHNGENVAAYVMREIPRRLGQHVDTTGDPASALKHVFEDINSSLPKSGISAVFGGTTAVVALVRGPMVWVANAGDSRAIVAGRGPDGGVGIIARALTRDQNPDSPGERERIESMGGFVSDPEEPGASARVWLDATQTMVGLAMARSIGDLAVKSVGVISEPEVTEYELTPTDEFLVLASDGVWEFIDNQEAAEVVQDLLAKGEDAAGACKGLMELANRRWSDMVGDYRDDITATVVRLPFLPPIAAAAATAAAAAAAAAAISSRSAKSASADTVFCSSGTLTDKRARNAAGISSVAAAEPGKADDDDDCITIGAGAAAAAAAAMGVSTKAERRVTVPSFAALPAVSLLSATEISNSVAPPPPLDSGAVAGGGTGEHKEEGDEPDGRIPSELTSTPAITPDGASEDDENDVTVGGGGGCTAIGKGAEGENAPLLSSAISDAFVDGDVSSALSSGSRMMDMREGGGGGGGRGGESPAGSEHVDINDSDGEMGDEEWELDFGAREHREPSREIREASREFPTSVVSLGGEQADPLAAFVVGMEQRRE